MLVDNPPSDALIEWTRHSLANRIKLAADRPWFQATPPPIDTAAWEYACRCGASVPVTRYACTDGRHSVYVGQCRRCETVLWSWRGGE